MSKFKERKNRSPRIPKNLSKVEKREATGKKSFKITSNAFVDSDLVKLSSRKESKKPQEIHEDQFSSLWLNYKSHNSLIVKTGQEWQSQLLEERQERTIPLSIRQRLKEYAQSLYFEDLSTFKRVDNKRFQSADEKLRKVVLSHGTTKDKIAALALECMESPVHTLHSFNNLVSYISPKGKNQYYEIIDHVKNLVDSTYLANSYTAKEFECHNFSMLIPLIASNREATEKQLVLWYFEDQFCFSYKNLIKNLEMLTNDTVHKIKIIGLKGLLALISNHPHQMNEEILAKLVNKLGDSAQKTCAFVHRGLSNLIRKHSFLKLTVLSLVEELLYRPNVPKRARYFALSFLKDFILKEGEERLAQKLVKLYMGFFKSCSKSGEVDSRFMSALLRGLYRAYPYAQKDGDSQTLEQQLDTLYKLCHLVNFNIATQALQLIYQVQAKSSPEASNRFYQVLYNLLLDSAFGSSTSCSAFLNLIFKVMSKDPDIQRVRAYAKRLLQVAKYQPPQNVCGILYLISEVAKDNSKLGSLRTLLASSKQHLADVKIEDDDEDELYPDLDADEEGNILQNGKPFKKEDDRLKGSEEISAPSWIHRSNLGSEAIQLLKTTHYDPSIRNPLYSGAQLTCLWELTELQAHYHPTVSLFASRILGDLFVEYSGDPLEDFTLMKFLDRFIHRNPKKMKDDKGLSIFGIKSKALTGSKRFNIDSREFSSLDENKVPVEDYFFFKYFKSYAKDNEQSRDDDDTESIDDDEFEQILRKKSYGHFIDAGLCNIDEIDFKKCASNVKGGHINDDDDEDDDDDEEGENEEADEEEDTPAEEEDDDDEDEDEEGLSDEDLEEFKKGLSDMSENEELTQGGDENEEEEEDFSDSDGSFEDLSRNKKEIKKKKGKKFDVDDDLDGLIADPDDYAHLLGEDYRPTSGTSDDIFVKDKSGARQLSWEKKRYGSSKHGGTNQHGKTFKPKKNKFNKSKR